ncbi:hypothetical protein, partial [Limnohabitans sp.]|uniref:hypothetical protein n=1 Tax=Limnohabitans sp. TaxID=1907725 RepID=UPI00286ED597
CAAWVPRLTQAGGTENVSPRTHSAQQWHNNTPIPTYVSRRTQAAQLWHNNSPIQTSVSRSLWVEGVGR